MKDYVEFTGKTLDDAINGALSYFGVEREKLEIEIVNDAKTGIFGLVGAKKATVRAKRAQLATVDLDLGKSAKSVRPAQSGQTAPTSQVEPAASPAKTAGASQAEQSPRSAKTAGPVQSDKSAQPVRSAKPARAEQPGKPANTEQSGKPVPSAKPVSPAMASQSGHKHKAGPKGSQPEKICPKGDPLEKICADEAAPDFDEQLPELALEAIDQEQLRTIVLETLSNLIRPIVGEAESNFSLSDGRVDLQVHCADNHGLLIGRDGQTLASLQYLLSCIVSRRLGASIRVQIDAGDYREKQDEKLRELALGLAQKVKSSSRPQSTKPLSAYHRRIIHMTLQDDPEVQTHSKGEGGLKRVVVVPRRKHSS